MHKTLTIKDVAMRAGVAISTVSRVINNMDRVSPSTRAAVQNAIDELGYIRNDLAASVKSGKKMFIIAVVPDLINEIYTAAVRGVEEIASAHGYYTLVYATNETAQKRSDVFDSKFMQIVDGVILLPSFYDVETHQSITKPLVIIDRELPGNTGYSVTLDNYGGACALTQELIDCGHEKIAIIAGRSEFNVTVDRVRGFKDTLRKNHIPLRDDYVRMGDWYQETGYSCTGELLSLGDAPTAIFAFNNQICLGCAKYMMEHGLTIGKDISLAEFDDWQVAQYLGPGITSMRSPISEMGRTGAKMLLALIENRADKIPQRNKQLGVELIRRKSIAVL